MTFKDLNLDESILESLEKLGYENPTPVQGEAIPPALEGKDLLACAQTGTGKTAAFSLPIIHALAKDQSHKRKVRALIVTPTRELAIQIADNITGYAKLTKVRHAVIYGGVSQRDQVRQLNKGVDILVATPGRLLDLIQQKYIRLGGIEHLVLDEADRMLDMGFLPDIKRIMQHVPEERQTLFFSATMPTDIAKLANNILKNPVRVDIEPEVTTAETVDQSYYLVAREDKKSLLLHLLDERNVTSAIVFTRTKYGADKLSRYLRKNGIRSEAIHGDKSQNNRQRTLTQFRAKKIRILCATDIAARGIDVDDLSHVINYEIPHETETYVHRIGRTGRAGNSGEAISLCGDDERKDMQAIMNLIGRDIPLESDQPYRSDNQTPIHYGVAERKGGGGKGPRGGRGGGKNGSGGGGGGKKRYQRRKSGGGYGGGGNSGGNKSGGGGRNKFRGKATSRRDS